MTRIWVIEYRVPRFGKKWSFHQTLRHYRTRAEAKAAIPAISERYGDGMTEYRAVPYIHEEPGR